MPDSISAQTLDQFTTFGDLLRYLRRRARLTQIELSIAVGYSAAQITRLEKNQRPPDTATVRARFIEPLGLEHEPEVVARLLELAARVRREDAPTLGLCPYKGMDFFDEADADLFVGREDLTAKITQRILALAAQGQTGKSRFLAVVGASGSGKSSLVRAGLVPALRWDNQSADWQIRILTPTAHPLTSLAGSLFAHGDPATFIKDPHSLHLFAQHILEDDKDQRRSTHAAQRLILVIDQFEELFALCRSKEERAGFIDNLLTAASEVDGPVIVIITLRADFYAYCAEYPQLREALAAQQEYIGAMSGVELRRAIEEPARRGNWELEPGLVSLLLQDVGREPGALPLLSHALLETWQRRRGRTMTLSGYASSGGVRGAIAETAEAVFTDQFSREQQVIARYIFLRLTELGDETTVADTRRRATINELILSPSESNTTREVLKTLADARLITLNEDTAEVAHEALIREWPTLRGWLDGNREGLRFHRQLTESAQDWVAANHDPDLLYRGARLAQAREWADANSADLNALEKEYLNTSIESSQREAAEREAQRQRELEVAKKLVETERRSATRLRHRAYLLGGVLALAVLLAGMAMFFGNSAKQSAAAAQESALTAQHNASEANDAKSTAQAEVQARTREESIAQSNFARADAQRLAGEASHLILTKSLSSDVIELAALLAIRSLNTAHTPQADELITSLVSLPALPRTFSGHTGNILGVAFSPDGQSLATTSADGTVRLWDLITGKSIRQFPVNSAETSDVVFSPDGRSLLSINTKDAVAKLWDIESGKQVQVFAGCDKMTFVSISPDGKYMVSNCGDSSPRIWSVSTGQVIQMLTGPTSAVTQVTFSSTGKDVLAGSKDGTAYLWDFASGELLQSFSGNVSQVLTVAFSPDGKYIATADVSGSARLWNLASGKVVTKFYGHSDIITDLTFSPDSHSLLTGSADGTARLWDVATAETRRVFRSNAGGVEAVAYSADGSFIAIAVTDSIARAWNLQASPVEIQFPAPPGIVRDASFSPDGKRIITANWDGNGRIWDAVTGRLLLTLVGHTNTITGADFSPDGRWALTAGAIDEPDNTIRLWDAATGQQLRKFEGPTGRAIFSPDGKLIVSTSASITEGGSWVWDVQTGRLITSKPGCFGRPAFSPDGKWVVNRCVDRLSSIQAFHIWDPLTGKDAMVLDANLPLLVFAFFSSDGRYLITASCCSDNTGIIWDLQTGKEVTRGEGWTGPFSPDGKYIVAGNVADNGDDRPLRILDWRTGEEVRRFSNPSPRYNVTFSPDGKYLLAADEDGIARMWLVDLHDSIVAMCAALPRDFTAEEMQQYDIHDAVPTCPKP